MPKHKPVHPIFNNRWMPLIIVIAAILIDLFSGAAVYIWSGFFEGTIYGKVVMENGDTDSRRLENIEISWYTSDKIRQCKPILTNTIGEYRFERDVPVGYPLYMTAKYEIGKSGYYREIRKMVDEIEGVSWFLGLPLSSGIPKRVDFVIPEKPPPIFGNQ